MITPKKQYSDEFREQALAKVYNRGKRTIQDIADESNLSIHTLKNWMKSSTPTDTSSPNVGKRPQDWLPEERLLALHESHGISGEALNAWCRQRGLFAHQLAQWKSDFCAVTSARSGGNDSQTLRTLKAENQRLERELNRKDKALAEAAALLILQKKVPGAVGGRGRMTSLQQRQTLIESVAEATEAGARQDQACAVLGLSPRTLQRWQAGETPGEDQRPLRQYTPAHALTEAERAHILTVANSAEFADLPPSQIVPRLADQGIYLGSESTFHRLLKAAQQLKHRRSERPSQPRLKPKALSATAPNQLYSWDITYLAAAVKGQFYYLYLFLDIFSRRIVGWQVFEAESSQYASELLRDIVLREGLQPGQVILHSDNGSPMKGATMLATLQQLGVMPSLSRPAVSNDNPYSESLFKTLKYRPQYPLKPFADLVAARQWVADLVQWYNHEHRHSAIGFVTPAQRHAGLDEALLNQRKALYEDARRQNPRRWSQNTRNWNRVHTVHLNPDHAETQNNSPREVANPDKITA
ncbi:IS3 family transposase [Methylomonas methanica]|nr:IS3 family transposase [Methylomonas methanica]